MTVYHNIGYMLKLHKVHIIIKYYSQVISKYTKTGKNNNNKNKMKFSHHFNLKNLLNLNSNHSFTFKMFNLSPKIDPIDLLSYF